MSVSVSMSPATERYEMRHNQRHEAGGGGC